MKQFAFALLALLVSACASFSHGGQRMNEEQAIDLPVMCKAGPDCDKKWSRADQWVTQHTVFNIPVHTATLIQTEQPGGLDGRAGFTLSKTHDNDDIYAIKFKVTCNNWFGCNPPTIESSADFVNFVTASPADTSKPKFGIRVHPISAAEVRSRGLTDTHGAVAVSSVASRSVGERAGLIIGDVIVQYDGHSVTTEDELQQLAATTPVNLPFTILIFRGKERQLLKARF